MTKGLLRSHERGPKSRMPIVKTRINLAGKTIDVTSVSSAVGFGAAVISDFAEGNILVLGIAGTIGFAGSGADADLSDTWNGDYSIGTTPTADVTLSGTDVDLIASTAIGAASAEVIAAARVAAALAPTMFDNTDGSLEINLNVLIDAADIVDDKVVTLTLSGVIDIAYIVLGDD